MNREWVGVTVRTAQDADLARAFATPDLLNAVAPLDCAVFVQSAEFVVECLQAVLPSKNVLLIIPAASLLAEGASKALRGLDDAGYRILLDGAMPEGAPAPGGAAVRPVAFDSRTATGQGQRRVAPVFGPHLAYAVDSIERLEQCANAGFSWFSGDFELHPKRRELAPDDGTTRRRLLSLLGLLARDGDARDIEALLKQDPALSYHLLKLANSAAFSVGTPIHGFTQAINVLGRRQLQRWLQLLLYARPERSGPDNALLPLAALRGAQMEQLCREQGGARDEQDLAFMVGVFSLLDLLLNMAMDDIVDSLRLPAQGAQALRGREGPLGRLLALTERAPDPAQLDQAGVSQDAFWRSQLHAYRWAIQVSRNL
jgi:EAL and modified HD-GYP domain-containing signal transduction protein